MESRLKEVEYWTKKSDNSINAAELLLENGFCAEAVSHAYYAVLYIVKALFIKDRISAYKPVSIITALGRDYVMPGLLGASFHRNMLQIFDKYYSLSFTPYVQESSETVQDLITMTKEIQSEILNLINISEESNIKKIVM